MSNLPVGLYDLLHTSQLHIRLEKAGLLESSVWSEILPEEFNRRLVLKQIMNWRG